MKLTVEPTSQNSAAASPSAALLQRNQIAASVHEAPASVQEVLNSTGQPLDLTSRDLFEPRFGADFSQVRVHTDADAARSARSVNALAYTVGNDIVFGQGQYHLADDSSQSLMAHELGHVIEQRRTGRLAVARQPDQQYEERGVAITRANMESLTGASYWEQKVMEVYALTPGTSRLSDKEERDAVLSVLWARRPPGEVTAAKEIDVQIPARAGNAASKPLLYKFKFQPKNAAVPDSKPGVTIEFMAEGAGTTAVIPAKPPLTYSPSISSYSLQNFPPGVPDYFEAHRDEERILFHWIQKEAPIKFNQLIKARTTTTKKKVTTTTETSFLVEGEKDKRGAVSWVSIRYLGSFQPALQAVPTDYRAKDYADVLLERAQAKPDDVTHDTLGKVNIPAGTTADEQFAVKYYVLQYFKSFTDSTGKAVSGTRNSEVDAIVLIPNKPTKVLYTFRFHPNNDVDVERVGEMGPDAAAGQINPGKLDVARAPEFAEKAKDAKTFGAWLKVRYPKVPVTGTTVEEMRTSVNAEAEAKADKPEWFKNYEINVLDADAGKARLKTAHSYKEQQVADMKSFLPAELRLLEVALQTMARKVLDVIKYVRMTRQRISIEAQPDRTFKENPKWAGLQLTKGSNKSIIIFDNTFTADPTQFLGGPEGVLPEAAEVYAHELGHVVGSASVERKFNEFVAKNNIKPFTRYAAESEAEGKKREFFAEAFSMFQVDPEWLRNNYSTLYAWFETLTKTGKPPTP